MKRPRVCDSFQVDRELTEHRRESSVYKDPRSVIHFSGKEYLFGADKTRRRMEVYERDKRRCVKCGVFMTFDQMEMDHIGANFGQMRWDNLENLRALCGPFQNGCHRGSKGAKHT